MNVEGFEIQITKKRIKNINLRIHPDGNIKLSAPYKLPDHKIQSFIKSKISWIKKRKVSKREYVSGELHFFLGDKYKLKVINTEDSPIVKIDENITIYAKPGSDIEKILYDFYCSELKKQIPLLIKKWEKIIGKKVNQFRIKRMKSRWGSCNVRNNKISINSEVAKRPLHCIEYVVVHEMVHLIEQSHNKRFWDLMTLFLPEWKQCRKELKSSI